MHNIRTNFTKVDTTPFPIGATYTATLTDTGEARLVHASDDETLPLEKHNIAGYTAYTRGTPHFTAVHVNLTDITYPGLLANALAAENLLPLASRERTQWVEWMKANRKHLQHLKAAGM